MLEQKVAMPDVPAHPVQARGSRAYAWLVFAVIYGLMLSDYMSRQVLSAVFPHLKVEWTLSDAQLGLLSGIVGLMVGLLAVPVAIMADRWGRVKSVVLMALFWSLSTLACGLAEHYGQLLLARLFVGIGEAGYGSVGLAVIMSVFPPSMRASLTGAFTSAGMFGSVLGMASGGMIATRFGWRAAMFFMAAFGLLLIAAYMASVTEARLARHAHRQAGAAAVASTRRFQSSGWDLFAKLAKALFGARTLVFSYAGSGLQLFVAYSIIAWMPSYVHRYYHLPADKSALAAAGLLIASGIGMALCGVLSDWVGRKAAERTVTLAIIYSLGSCALLMVAMRLPPGPLQFAMIAAGVFLAAGTFGPVGAMVANLVPVSIHSTAMATLSLANNLLGAFSGPYLTGVAADRIGLLGALQWMPLVSLAAALAFVFARANYARDLRRFAANGAHQAF
jgi:MFS family permease